MKVIISEETSYDNIITITPIPVTYIGIDIPENDIVDIQVSIYISSQINSDFASN